MILEMNSDSAGAEKLPVAGAVTGTVEVVVAGGAVVATGAVVVVMTGAAVVVVTGLVVVVVAGLVVVVVTGVVVVVTGVVVAMAAGTVVVVVDEATVTVGKLWVVVGVAPDAVGATIRAGLVGESVSSSVSSTGVVSLNATSSGASSTTTGGAIPILATWIRRTHAAVAVARAIARRIKVPTPIVRSRGSSARPGNPVVDRHSEWLYRPNWSIS